MRPASDTVESLVGGSALPSNASNLAMAVAASPDRLKRGG
jgi:hypothetical protein